MFSQRPPNVRIDPDGVRTTTSNAVRPGVWLLIAVVIVLCAGLLLRQHGTRDSTPVRVTGPAGGSRSTSGGSAAREGPAEQGLGGRVRLPVRDVPALTKQVPAAEEADPDIADADGDAPSGIALFPPPGTDPIKQGIVVPEDFELPQGYVRHHQVTDDGKPLPAILMFHPDYNPTDEQGNPLSLPADRVVPADMAPPGLAIEMLDVPDTVVPQIEERDDSAARETAPQH